MNEISIIKASPSVITIECDSSIADDLIFILEKLLMMSKIMKKKIRFMEAEKKAADPDNMALLQTEFNIKSIDVYKEYLTLRGTEKSHSGAIKALKGVFALGYYETEIYVTQGRKLQREEKYDKVRADHDSGGYSISELAALHGMSYNTVKKIVNNCK